ncbi:MAG: hemerythrin domain-containing protein [Deltaproteobacteria bacterium]|nr:hemerythrin domain-containing protein [Deltaproteobacteria bacterium]
MSGIDNLRHQHKAILGIVEQMTLLLDAEQLTMSGDVVRRHLSRVAGQLTVHFAMEDHGLYPRLLSDPDEQIRARTERIADEVDGIKAAFAEYLSRWPTAKAIEHSATRFIDETRAIFAALGARINTEENELYPLLDKVADRALGTRAISAISSCDDRLVPRPGASTDT